MDEQKSEDAQRRALLEMVKKGEAKIVESIATRFEVGTTSILENKVERIYPTEYEPSEGIAAGSTLDRPDEKLTPSERKLKTAMKFACPTSFDTKLVGNSLEAKVKVVDDEEELWDVMLLINNVDYLGDVSWVEDTIVMPQCGVTRQNNFLRVEVGEWSFLNSQNKVSEGGKSDSEATHYSSLNVKRVR